MGNDENEEIKKCFTIRTRDEKLKDKENEINLLCVLYERNDKNIH